MADAEFLREMLEARRICTELADELLFRFPDVEKFDRYYRGEHRLHFASDEFNNYFAKRYANFSDNWCGVIADAPTERLEVVGIHPYGTGKRSGAPIGDDELWRDWRGNDADHTSDMAFVEANIGKRAYALVWGDDHGDPVITFEHATQAIIGYDSSTGRRLAGLKLWRDEKREYATLYLPDDVWKFQRERIKEGRTESGLYVTGHDVGGWEPRHPAGESWPIPNPLGEVPLVELPNRPRLLAEPLSDIAGATSMQDAMNLFWSYLLNAADFASFPQRVVMGGDRPTVPVLDATGQEVGRKDVDLKKFAVDRVLWLEHPNAKIGEWTAANLAIYTGVLETMVGHVASQTRTPHHYLMAKTPNMSGDGLKAAETGLVMRSKEKTQSYGRGIREVFRLTARVRGDEKKALAVKAGKVLWRDVESRSEAQSVDAALKLRQIGFPLEYIARRLDLGPDDIADVMAMIERERASGVLEQLQRSFEQPSAGDDVDELDDQVDDDEV